MSVTELGRTPAAAREQLLDAAAVDGLDLAAARATVDQLARGRRRALRGGLAALGVVALVGLGAWTVLGGDDPDELVADRVEPTSTTSTTTTTAAPPASAVTAPPMAPTTSAPTTTLAPTTTVATTTTVPTNQALRAELQLSSPRVAAGEVASLEVAWVDPDHAGADPEVLVDWGDPAVSALSLPTPATRCDTPGASSGGTARREFRYATPGERRVRVTVTTCGGEGVFAERVTLESTVTVGDALLDGAPGTAVVVAAARTANGLPVLPALDGAEAVLVPEDPAEPTLELGSRSPVLLQFGDVGPRDGAGLPRGAVGELQLTWPGSPCTSTAAVDLGTTTPGTPVLVLDSSC